MLAFAHLRKTAGTTMLTILRRNYGTRLFETRGFAPRLDLTGDDLHQVKLLYRRLECVAGEQVSPGGDLYEKHPRLRFFTFVRDPISRCVSNFQWYLNCTAKCHYPGVPTQWLPAKWRLPTDFKGFVRQWLEKYQRNLQTQRLAGCQDAERAIEVLTQRVGFVGMVEQFNESLVMWREWSGNPGLNIHYQPQNVSTEGRFPQQKMLRKLMSDDPAIAKLVAEFNELDNRLYSFVRTELYPAQLARYERSLRATAPESLVQQGGLDAGSINTARRWIFRTLVYKPLRPVLFRRSA